jgi:hypothetical protein
LTNFQNIVMRPAAQVKKDGMMDSSAVDVQRLLPPASPVGGTDG